MADIHIRSGEPWNGPSLSMTSADQVVSHYFTAARNALLRADAASDPFLANAEKLSALFVLLSRFEAFLNCYYRSLADELGGPRRAKIVAIVEDRREPLRGKAYKLPWQAFGDRSKAIDAALLEIEEYIAIRYRFMHLKHDWNSITVDGNVTVRGLMDTTVMNHDVRWTLLPLFVAIRRYMKDTFALRGTGDIQSAIDRWTKPASDWRVPQRPPA